MEMKVIEQLMPVLKALSNFGIMGLYGVTIFLIYKLADKFLTALVAAVKENSAALGKLSGLIETLTGRREEKKK